MRRLSITLALALVFMASVSFVSAQTPEQLQQQIAQLLQQVAQLQAAITAQSGNPGGTSNTTPGTGNPSTAQGCLSLSRNLGLGSSGNDVTQLQQFLAKDTTLYPEGQITGYYGPLTMRAVQRWQARFNIVSSGTPDTTGYGAVGPMTRKAFAGCGDVLPAQFGGFMRVTPVSGNAPLTVSATVTVNTARSCDAASYRVDFGDGTAPFQIAVPGNRCAELEQTITHTYTNPGTYTASLGIGSHRSTVTVTVGGTGSNATTTNPTNPGCPVPPSQPPAASCVGVWERVYNTNSCHTQWRCSGIQPLTINPTTGAAPLTATASFNIRSGDPYEIVWGDGTPNTIVGSFSALADLSADTVVLPSADNRVNVQHTYSKTGTFNVAMRHGSYEKDGNLWVWRVRQYSGTVTVSGTSVSDSITTAIASGTTPFTASFTVNINGSGSCDAGTYTVDFGDSSTKTELTYPVNSCTSKTFTITHNYTTSGAFTVRLYKGTAAQTNAGTASQVASVVVNSIATALSSGPFTVSPTGAARTFQASFTLPSAEACNSYRLNWGDGTAEVIKNPTSQTCSQAVFTKVLTHTYAANATYTITLRRAVGAMTEATPEETATVTLGGGS